MIYRVQRARGMLIEGEHLLLLLFVFRGPHNTGNVTSTYVVGASGERLSAGREKDVAYFQLPSLPCGSVREDLFDSDQSGPGTRDHSARFAVLSWRETGPGWCRIGRRHDAARNTQTETLNCLVDRYFDDVI